MHNSDYLSLIKIPDVFDHYDHYCPYLHYLLSRF
jgi:hypothetical protein